MKNYFIEAIARQYRKQYKRLTGKHITGKAELIVIDTLAYREFLLRTMYGAPLKLKSFEKRLNRFVNRKPKSK